MTEAAQLPRAALLPLAVRVLWGGTLLVDPGTVLRLFRGVDEGKEPRLVMRILGGRHLIQAGVEYHDGGGARQIGVVVDLLHATTSIVFGIVRPTWRRAALTDAGVAVGFAMLGLTNG